MSRPRKMHKPIKGSLNGILAAIGMGSGAGKKSAKALARKKQASRSSEKPKRQPD